MDSLYEQSPKGGPISDVVCTTGPCPGIGGTSDPILVRVRNVYLGHHAQMCRP